MPNIDLRNKQSKAQTKGEKIFVSLITIAFLLLMALELLDNYTPAKLGAVLLILFWIPLLFVHEWGHAMMAKLLGWQVRKTVIGVGRLLFETTLFNAPLEIRSMPLEGFVQVAPLNMKRPRLKNALIYFAGPGIELFVFFIILLTLGSEQFFASSDRYVIIMWQSLAYAALASAIINLIPMGILNEDGQTANDGLGIILCLVTSDEDFLEWLKIDEISK